MRGCAWQPCLATGRDDGSWQQVEPAGPCVAWEGWGLAYQGQQADYLLELPLSLDTEVFTVIGSAFPDTPEDLESMLPAVCDF